MRAFKFSILGHAARNVRFMLTNQHIPLRAAKLGARVAISPTASFRNGSRISIGDRSHIGQGALIWAGDEHAGVVIGQDCLIAPYVVVSASNYGLSAGALIMTQPKMEANIVVGDDVWIGAGAVVTAGVRIGSHAVVGAGAVVTADIPANAIAVGVPAKVRGYRQA